MDTQTRAQGPRPILRQPSFPPPAATAAAIDENYFASDHDDEEEADEFKTTVDYLQRKKDATYSGKKDPNEDEEETLSHVSRNDGYDDFNGKNEDDFDSFEEVEDAKVCPHDDDSYFNDVLTQFDDLSFEDILKLTTDEIDDDIKYNYHMAGPFLDENDNSLRLTVKIELASGMTDADCLCKLEHGGKVLVLDEKFPEILLEGSKVVQDHSKIGASSAKAVAMNNIVKQTRLPIDRCEIEELNSVMKIPLPFACEFATEYQQVVDASGQEFEEEVLIDPMVYKHKHLEKEGRKKKQTVNCFYVELRSLAEPEVGGETVSEVIDG